MATMDVVKKQAANSQLVTVEDYIKKNDKLIRNALQNTITPERFLAVISIVMQEPALVGCTQESLVAAMLQTVQIGLTPGKIGQVYYVPFYNKGKKEVQLMIGYRGLVELINRSKEATILNAEVVYAADQFQYEKGLNPILRHIPANGNRGEIIGVYCIAKNNLANEKVFNYLQKEEVEKVKNESLNKIPADKRQYSPWVKWEEAMWVKTAVRRIAKLLPLSVEVQQSIEADETIKTHISEKMVDVPDKTDWNSAAEAETVAEPMPGSGNSEVNAYYKAPEAPVSPDQQKDSPAPVSLFEAPVGSVIVEFKALVKSFKVRKPKTKEITDYSVEDEHGTSFSISRWGMPHEGCENAICTFLEITVQEFNKTRQYLAKEIKNESIVWEE